MRSLVTGLAASAPSLAASVGWVATAVFTASYFCKRPLLLRLVQMGGAALWLAYGVLIDAMPVIVANGALLLVAGVTTLTAVKGNATLTEVDGGL